MYASVRFIRVENDRPITHKQDPDFYMLLQQSILLSLMDAGTLSRMQYRCALDILEKQRSNIVPAAANPEGIP